MTADQVYAGLGLIVVLAVGSQLLASRLRVPALLVLLPAGFIAGAVTDDVDPQLLLGSAFSPLVSLAVAVILYDAGLGLDLKRLRGHNRRVVIRLLWLGVLLTVVSAALFAVPVLDMSAQSAVMLAAILVVSGPTVVGPLLSFVRPTERLRRILVWEGSLIDPVGGILGALVFHGVLAGNRPGFGDGLVHFLASAVLGVAAGAAGAAVLWLLLGRARLSEELATSAQLAAVIGVAAGCDALRDDTGLIAAVVMGMAMANLPGLDLPARRPFFETLVSLIIGLLFVSISATVTPASLRHVVLPSLALVALLVLVTRPLVAHLAAMGTDVPGRERWFIGWMAPRGIVAAATASTFSTELADHHVAGAERILPATFVVIVATVMLYGLTAFPVARRLGVLRPARSRPLLVGGAPWVVDAACALRAAGLDVLMWAGADEERARIEAAGLSLAPGELFASATGAGAELEGITSVLLLTGEDDFNALASVTLRESVEGTVGRLAPPSASHGVLAPYTGGDALFGPGLTRADIDAKYEAGARVVTRTADGPLPADERVLFVVGAEGRLEVVTDGGRPEPVPGDTLVVLREA
ncbi:MULTISPECIES: cation:proton antiporter [unclassified Streptomyces]|uniref:cation:proton antiporter n=1 Tax=unclassified Streptomyces TaxID=2593676 RepID=UPI000DAD5913|nr:MULTISPECIES: cation:proton antiporter [unclassified Streptomyces]PZT73699.1 sodium:proton exchanger [Streptomyces sp. AC1-42T]PZT83307.1 sodium:proton exchanger [Streptomyces sp. AC1-42W]